jgi:hypothetical protein
MIGTVCGQLTIVEELLTSTGKIYVCKCACGKTGVRRSKIILQSRASEPKCSDCARAKRKRKPYYVRFVTEAEIERAK